MTVRTIDEIFRDFVTDGVPASGPFNPHKPDIRDTLKALTEGTDNFPDNRVIRLNNANEGTANNIVVTASVAIPAAAYQVLYILNVTQENTGPVTVSGAINRDLVTNISQPVPAGYLTPGMALLCIDTGTELRLLSYGDAEAILAAAEAAALRAEQAAQDAEDAAATANGVAPVVNRAQLKALDYSEKKSAIIYGENGCNGTFAFVQSDLSAKVALDPHEGIYVPPASDLTGVSGAWVRQSGWHVSGVSAEWFGVVADSDGTTGNGTDNQPAMQAACDTIQALSIPAVNLPMGIIRFGSQVLVEKKSVTIRGAGMGLPDAWPAPIIPTKSNGTWLYFDHTGIGIKFEIDETNPRFASRVEHLTTMRNQPAPGAGWVPTVAGADFDMWAHMVHFDDVGLLNPTIAFKMDNAPCSFNHIRAQPLYIFVSVDETADVCRWNDIHCWPYWSLDASVEAFTSNNLIVFDLGRCDNPQLSNVFSIRQRHGIRIRQGATGATQRLKGTNVEFDNGGSGLTTTPDTSDLIIQLVNFITFCSNELIADTRGIEIQGDGHQVQIVNTDISNTGAQAVLVLGNGNKVGITNYRLYNYGENTASAPGIEVGGNDSRIILEGVEDVSTSHSGLKYMTGGTGCAIVRDDWRSYAPSVTSSSGTLGSVTGIVGRYRRNLKSIDFQVEFIVNNIGTGAGAIRVGLPEASSAFASATGQQVNSGFNLNGTIDTGVSYVDIRKYDGTFPGLNSTAIRVSGTYPVA